MRNPSDRGGTTRGRAVPIRRWAVVAWALLACVAGLAGVLAPGTSDLAAAAPVPQQLQPAQSPAPTPTPLPLLDTSNAERVYCGGVYSGSTEIGANNVSRYDCRPWWDESGKEVVYRLELDTSQPVTVTLLASTADIDLFLLRYAYPDSCLAAGDTYLSYSARPGSHFLAVDGYRGAAGSYTLRVDCPAGPNATSTPTLTPSPTPTATPRGTATPTATSLPTVPPVPVFLPLVLQTTGSTPGFPVTLTLQDGLNGYAGTSDTTLSYWARAENYGADNRLLLFYSRTQEPSTQKAPVLRFDLDLLPAGAQIRAATLRLYAPLAPSQDLRARVQGLLRPWEELSATWDVAATGQAWGEPGARGEEADRTAWMSDSQHIVEGSRWYEFDVTPLAQQWGRDRRSNYGMILEAGAGDFDANVEARFISREGNGAWRPQFIVSYVLPTQ